MHFYTSVNNNYLPKARVLAKTIKHHCKDSFFSLVLCDQIPEGFELENEPFDEVVTIEELGIPVQNLSLWIFMHSVVELCTAVKGQALVKFLKEGSEKVVYLDPDIAVFSPLTELEELLDRYAVVLTPHLTHQEDNIRELILDNEICAMKHGVYNFGFYAVKNSIDGLKFAEWWRDRLVEFCYDDIPNGLFTDQRWGDLVPCLFDNVYVLRDPGYNVATWNINHRKVVQIEDGSFTVNDIPLKFYHFSGFDAGSQEAMLNKYGMNNAALWTLRNWYIEQQDSEGQEEFSGTPSCYQYYSNGEIIEKSERDILRKRPDVYQYFSDCDPFVIDTNITKCYKHDILNEKLIYNDLDSLYKERCMAAEIALNEVYHSTSWKITAWIRGIKDIFKKG